MKSKIILGFIFLFSSQILFAQNEETVVLKTETGDIEGSLVYSESEYNSTVALIIAGSGPTDRNGNNPQMKNNTYKMLAEGLEKHGISSLRYDKRGVGKSIAAYLNEVDLRFEHYVDDAKAWIDYLVQDKRFNKIIVIGHSEGSLIGMLASQKEEVTKYISLAGVGQPALNLIEKQLKAQPILVYNLSKPILEKLYKGDTTHKVPPILMAAFRPTIQPYLISWNKYDPCKEIQKLKKPVMLIQGTTDIQVKIEDIEALAKAKTKAQKVIVEGMNHVLKEAVADRAKNLATYNMPDLPLKEGLVKTITEFIKK